MKKRFIVFLLLTLNLGLLTAQNGLQNNSVEEFPSELTDLDASSFPIFEILDLDNEFYFVSYTVLLDRNGARKEFLWCRDEDSLFPVKFSDIVQIVFTDTYNSVYPGYTKANMILMDESLKTDIFVSTSGTITGLDPIDGSRISVYLNYNSVQQIRVYREVAAE